MLLINGQTIGVGEKLQAAEAGLANILQGAEPDDQTRNLIGLIAMASATLALTRYDVKAMLAQSHRALEYLDPNSLFHAQRELDFGIRLHPPGRPGSQPVRRLRSQSFSAKPPGRCSP